MASISYTLHDGSTIIDLGIYDANQNKVKTFLDQELAIAGSHQLTWNGCNDSGIIVPDGIYTYQMNIQGTAGASNIKKSGTITVDTSPPRFSNWIIPSNTKDEGKISVEVTDLSTINTTAAILQFSIADS